jgi:hypothetical protein
MPVSESNNPFTGRAQEIILEAMQDHLVNNPDAMVVDLEWEAGRALVREALEPVLLAFSDTELAWINGAATMLMRRKD